MFYTLVVELPHLVGRVGVGTALHLNAYFLSGGPGQKNQYFIVFGSQNGKKGNIYGKTPFCESKALYVKSNVTVENTLFMFMPRKLL